MARYFNIAGPCVASKHYTINSSERNVLQTSLVNYCRSLDKPLIILFDEADALRQLRSGYVNRSGEVPFANSVALVGMRNIRDYRSTASLGW